MKRFWDKVGIRHPAQCWLWKASLLSDTQYGQFRWEGQSTQAHRVSWILTYGPIPEGLFIRHSRGCLRHCVNPYHLKLGTHGDNMQDMVDHGRSQRGHDRWMSVLTEQDVREIRQLVTQHSCSDIAIKFGCSRQSINDIKSGRTWKWLV